MTGRERLQSLLAGRLVDRLCWTTLVDDRTRSGMPPEVRDMPILDFYRHLGCDIVQFGDYGLPEPTPSPARLVTPPVEIEHHNRADGAWVRTLKTEWGDLTVIWRDGHPVRHPVQSLDELRTLRNLWAGSHYEEVPAAAEAFARADAAIGDDGLYCPTVEPSPVQQLLEVEMGAAGFYYMLEDHRREMEDLLEVMHAARCQEYDLLARLSPAQVVIPVENTSSTMISPRLYERYSLPQIRDYVDALHRGGKKCVLHMCGHLKALLPALRKTGLDGINALTPPTVGDTTCEEVLDYFGEDFLIWGAVMDPTVFQRGRISADEIGRALDDFFTPRLRRAHLVLWLPADGLPTPLDRFLAVRHWMLSHGSPP
jgi:hypothetical protein